MQTLLVPANYPWLPSSWVGGGNICYLRELSDSSRKKYAAVKATAAILRAMRG